MNNSFSLCSAFNALRFNYFHDNFIKTTGTRYMWCASSVVQIESNVMAQCYYALSKDPFANTHFILTKLAIEYRKMEYFYNHLLFSCLHSFSSHEFFFYFFIFLRFAVFLVLYSYCVHLLVILGIFSFILVQCDKILVFCRFGSIFSR